MLRLSGRFLGALVGGVALAAAGSVQMYQACALAAALLGWLYFSLYHCCLRPRCGRKTPPSQELATDGNTVFYFLRVVLNRPVSQN